MSSLPNSVAADSPARPRGIGSHEAMVAALGEGVIIWGFVLAEFTDVTLGHYGHLTITLQKLALAVIFPYGIALIGGGLKGSVRFLWTAVALAVAFGVAFMVGSAPSVGSLLSSVGAWIPGLIGAFAIYSVVVRPGAFPRFARAWALVAVGSAALAFLQAIGRLPLWTVSSGDLSRRVVGANLYRGTGLKFDPNFEALVLVIGLVFARYYITRFRRLSIAVILLGIVATFSRMGVVIAGISLVAAPLFERDVIGVTRSVALRRALAICAVFVLGVTGLATLAPRNIRGVADERIQAVVDVYRKAVGEAVAPTGPNPTSANERVLLAGAAFQVFWSHPLTGVGAYKAEDAIFALTGDRKAAHDSYLETLAIGGIFGALAIATYAGMIAGAFRGAAKGREDRRARAALRAIVLAFVLMGTLLTVDYNAILWLPLILVAAYERRSLKGMADSVLDAPRSAVVDTVS